MIMLIIMTIILSITKIMVTRITMLIITMMVIMIMIRQGMFNLLYTYKWRPQLTLDILASPLNDH